MGSCMSSDNAAGVEVTRLDKALNTRAEKVMREAKAQMQNLSKLLLLGSGDSGKSTVLKQMRLIHNIPFTPREIESYRHVIFYNITHGLGLVLDAMEEMELKIPESIAPYHSLLTQAPDIQDQQPFPSEYRTILQTVWDDPVVAQAWERAAEAALPDNLSYFMPDLDRLFETDYQPTTQDIIYSRVRTTGINEMVFKVKGRDLLIVDVGGQRSERRKWIHCFEGVTAIIFMVSLNGYDQRMVEDKIANQMQDAMAIWHSICGLRWFKDTTFILFLNKNDLFEQKILRSDIKRYFPDFDGDSNDATAIRSYFKKRFRRLARFHDKDRDKDKDKDKDKTREVQPPKSPVADGKERTREIYTHVTTATDTDMLTVVIFSVEDVIMRENLAEVGLL